MKILDVCCGSRMFWYDKEEPHTTYMDIRNAIYTAMDRGNELEFQSPNDETTLLYQFNKRRMESFIYDIESRIYREAIK